MWFRQSKCWKRKIKERIKFGGEIRDKERNSFAAFFFFSREDTSVHFSSRWTFRKSGKTRKSTSRAYFAANRRAENELALSSRREYLRGPYTSTTTRTRRIRMKSVISAHARARAHSGALAVVSTRRNAIVPRFIASRARREYDSEL